MQCPTPAGREEADVESDTQSSTNKWENSSGAYSAQQASIRPGDMLDYRDRRGKSGNTTCSELGGANGISHRALLHFQAKAAAMKGGEI